MCGNPRPVTFGGLEFCRLSCEVSLWQLYALLSQEYPASKMPVLMYSTDATLSSHTYSLPDRGLSLTEPVSLKIFIQLVMEFLCGASLL